jgi:hypothetical protein
MKHCRAREPLVALRAAAVVVVALSALSVSVAPASPRSTSTEASTVTPLVLRRPADRSYSLRLPAGWKFRTARTSAAAHTDTWFDPKHPHDRVLMVRRSTCRSCFSNAAGRPDPSLLARAVAKRGVLQVKKISAWEARFSGPAGEGTVRVGRAIITRKNGAAVGSIRLTFVVSGGQEPFANRVLSSLHIVK